MTPNTIHLVDDDPAVRAAIAFLLSTEGYVVHTYESGRAFLSAAGDTPGGCLVTDLRMPEMDGIDLLRAMRQSGIAMPVIVITGHGDVPLAVAAMKAGATDFIEKPFDDKTLFGAIEGAIARAANREPIPAGTEIARRRLADLSPREQDVLAGILDGMTNVAIAAGLDISPRTVEIYRANLMSKMQAGNLPELLRMTIPLRALLPALPRRPGGKRA